MRFRTSLMAALVAAAGAFAAGCASTAGSGTDAAEVVGPGTPFAFEGNDYKIMPVQDDFVLMRLVTPEGNPGEITGWVREVFRVSRYDLGEGRWYMYEGLPGAYLQWRGGDNFTIAKGEAYLGGAEVALLR